MEGLYEVYAWIKANPLLFGIVAIPMFLMLWSMTDGFRGFVRFLIFLAFALTGSVLILAIIVLFI